MPFRVITGTFHATGYAPDGDSLRFQPDDPSRLFELDGPPPKLNGRGHVQLRIEGIDALETHYSTRGGGTLRQPTRHAFAAMERLLGFAGIENVVWNERRSAVVSADDGTPGFILSRAVEKNRRPVAFVFAGEAPDEDGEEVFLDAGLLRDSFNHLALREGLAYATYYSGLFHDLRDEMTAAVAAAREEGLGLYADDVTTTGFDLRTIGQLTDDLVIMPKLFRRLAEYFVSAGTAVGFREALAENEEPVLEIATANFTHFDTFVEQEEGSSEIRLTVRPEDLVFDPMPARPTDSFARAVAEADDAALLAEALAED
jgi:endonuclease YncB( thermonuclease family)